METEEKELFTKIIGAYHPLSRDCIDALAALAHLDEFSKDEPIVCQDKPCGKIFIIKEGITRVSYRKKDKEDTICFGGGGDIFFSLHEFYCGDNPVFGLIAVDYKVQGWWISIQKFKALEEKYPELYKWMQFLLIEQLYSFEVLYRKLALSTPAEKFDNFWHFLAPNLRHKEAKSLSRTLPLKFLAQYLGITPQTLSKIRRKFVGK